jgi:hypothetical protein
MADKHVPVSGEAGYDPTKQPGYQEYPKALPSGQIVHSKEEEDAAMGKKAAPEPDPPTRHK